MTTLSEFPMLVPHPSFSIPVFSSAGLEEVAIDIATRINKANLFFQELFSLEPAFTLLILAPDDWSKHSDIPTYGMPHVLQEKLIVAGQRNDFWDSFIPNVEAATPEHLANAQRVYATADNGIDVSPFFHLLAIHELGHVFHNSISASFPRLWLMEIFANLCLHTYIAEEEPDQLPILETLPQGFEATDEEFLNFHSLAEFEDNYMRMHPVNYGWYQGRFHRAAKEIYDAGGIESLRRLWNQFVFSDQDLKNILTEKVHPKLSDIMTEWKN